jgi:hypothetical protein
MTARAVAERVSIIVIAEEPWIFIPDRAPKEEACKGRNKNDRSHPCSMLPVHSLAQPMHPVKQKATPIKIPIPNSP